MRKEVILAVIIGVLLGGIILYGINLANFSSKTNEETPSEDNNSTASSTPTSKASGQLTIITPQNNSVVTDAAINLKGSTKPNSNVAIISENDDIIVVADDSGNFSSDINLISGENIITITAVDDQQATTSSTLSIIRTATLPE